MRQRDIQFHDDINNKSDVMESVISCMESGGQEGVNRWLAIIIVYCGK